MPEIYRMRVYRTAGGPDSGCRLQRGWGGYSPSYWGELGKSKFLTFLVKIGVLCMFFAKLVVDEPSWITVRFNQPRWEAGYKIYRGLKI